MGPRLPAARQLWRPPCLDSQACLPALSCRCCAHCGYKRLLLALAQTARQSATAAVSWPSPGYVVVTAGAEASLCLLPAGYITVRRTSSHTLLAASECRQGHASQQPQCQQASWDACCGRERRSPRLAQAESWGTGNWVWSTGGSARLKSCHLNVMSLQRLYLNRCLDCMRKSPFFSACQLGPV